MPYWATLRTKSSCEERAEKCLKALGFEVYCPRVAVQRIRSRGRRVKVMRPMFACYVFLLVTGEWHRAVIPPSVLDIVRSDGATPGAVPDAAMAEIRRREAEAFVKSEPPQLKAGAVVRIREGPLDDRLGLCTSVRGSQVVVLLSMFGAERKVRFNRTAVEAV